MMKKLCAFTCLLALTACATAQENPHYQYSSKYIEDVEATQLATNSQPSPAAYVSPQMRAQYLNGQAASHAAQPDVTYANSQTVPNETSESVVVRPSEVGTPGYGAYVPESVEDYDYSENVVSANNTVLRNAEPQTVIMNPSSPAANFVVSSGDTVYNISRRLCVNVEEVQTPNNLGNDFAIDIGQPLYLPPSRC